MPVRPIRLLAIALTLTPGAALLAGPTAPTTKAPGAPVEILDLRMTTGSLWQVGDTYVAGQPTEDTIKELAERGVTVVISLRTAREMADPRSVPFDERALVRSLGLEYVQVGLGPYGSYTPETLALIRETIKRHDSKALLHCTSGARATTAWTAMRTKYDGLTLQEALEEGREMALWIDSIEQLLGERIEYVRTGEPSRPNPGWLVDAVWLAENIDKRHVRVLDVRPNTTKYFEGHAPNATHLDAHALRGPRDGLPAQFRSHERMAEIFAQANVAPANRVIVYAEGSDILSSAMTVYALEKLGHLNASILDGGHEALRRAGLLTQAYPAPPAEPASFPTFENPACVATLADVESALESGGVLFVDARPAAQHRGETNTWQRNGHIPGAVSFHWERCTADDDLHTLRTREELRSAFASAGVTPDQEIIVYCGTGREASLLYLVLTRELRYPNVRLYEGGWTEYSAQHHLPVGE